MKLYLSSIGLNNSTELYNLIGKNRNIKTAFITNAFELKIPEDQKIKYDLVIKNLKSLNLDLTEIDLKEYFNKPEALKTELSKYNFIWVCGGNVFYLRELMQQSGFDKIIKDLVSSGIVYGGDSVGVIVAGPSLHGFERADQINQVKTLIYEGLNLVDFLPLPHWENPKFQQVLLKIQNNCKQNNLEYLSFSDNQAVIVQNSGYKLIENFYENI